MSQWKIKFTIKKLAVHSKLHPNTIKMLKEKKDENEGEVVVLSDDSSSEAVSSGSEEEVSSSDDDDDEEDEDASEVDEPPVKKRKGVKKEKKDKEEEDDASEVAPSTTLTRALTKREWVAHSRHRFSPSTVGPRYSTRTAVVYTANFSRNHPQKSTHPRFSPGKGELVADTWPTSLSLLPPPFASSWLWRRSKPRKPRCCRSVGLLLQ